MGANAQVDAKAGKTQGEPKDEETVECEGIKFMCRQISSGKVTVCSARMGNWGRIEVC